MTHFIVVSKGEVATMYLAFQDAETRHGARQIVQRLQANNHIPGNTEVFGPSSKTKVITKQGEWFVFLLTLAPGIEEEIVKTVTLQLEKVLSISLQRLSDRKLQAAVAYTAAVMKQR